MSMSGAGEAGTEQSAVAGTQQQGVPRMTSVRSVDILEQIEEAAGDSGLDSGAEEREEDWDDEGAAATGPE